MNNTTHNENTGDPKLDAKKKRVNENSKRYADLCKRDKAIRIQREAIVTQFSKEKDKLNKMKQECRSIQSQFSNGLNSIRGKVDATDADVKWHGKSWTKWETILKTYEMLHIPKLMQSVYKMQCDLDRLGRQRQSISEQLGSIRYYNRYGKAMFK